MKFKLPDLIKPSTEPKLPIPSGLCERCEKNPTSDPHTCPYAEDVDGDSEFTCTCCDACTYECANGYLRFR